MHRIHYHQCKHYLFRFELCEKYASSGYDQYHIHDIIQHNHRIVQQKLFSWNKYSSRSNQHNTINRPPSQSVLACQWRWIVIRSIKNNNWWLGSNSSDVSSVQSMCITRIFRIFINCCMNKAIICDNYINSMNLHQMGFKFSHLIVPSNQRIKSNVKQFCDPGVTGWFLFVRHCCNDEFFSFFTTVRSFLTNIFGDLDSKTLSRHSIFQDETKENVWESLESYGMCCLFINNYRILINFIYWIYEWGHSQNFSRAHDSFILPNTQFLGHQWIEKIHSSRIFTVILCEFKEFLVLS